MLLKFLAKLFKKTRFNKKLIKKKSTFAAVLPSALFCSLTQG